MEVVKMSIWLNLRSCLVKCEFVVILDVKTCLFVFFSWFGKLEWVEIRELDVCYDIGYYYCEMLGGIVGGC